MQVEATRLYRVKAVAQMCELSPATVYRAIGAGRLTAVRFGAGNGGLRVSGEAFNAWLTACTVTANQVDGLACVVCEANFLTVATPHIPVGRSASGSQVFACSHHTTADIAQANLAALITLDVVREA